MKQIIQYEEITSMDDDDWLLVQPKNGGLYKKIKKSNLLKGLTASSNSSSSTTLSLLHFDGVNNSTTFTDSKGNAVINSGAIISTAQSKFGGASGFFSNAFLNVAYNSAFNLSNSSFTIEFWIYPSNLSSQQGLISRRSSSFVAGDWIIWLNSGGSENISMVAFDQSSSGNDFISTPSGSIAISQWNHVAIVRSVNTWNIYINGISRASLSQNFAFTPTTLPITIGRDNGGGGRFYFNGYIDEFRLDASAVYTAGFTPSTSAFI